MAKKQQGKEKKPGDPLKSFTLVMGFLVLLMGGLFLFISRARDAYAEANVRLERYALRGETFPELVQKVNRLAESFEKAGGHEGLHISRETINVQATRNAQLKVQAQPENVAPQGAFVTVRQKFDYANFDGSEPRIWQLLIALYNIETQTRYRVSELSWALQEKAMPEQFGLLRTNHFFEVAMRGPAKR